jgi:hypothetical protein
MKKAHFVNTVPENKANLGEYGYGHKLEEPISVIFDLNLIFLEFLCILVVIE